MKSNTVSIELDDINNEGNFPFLLFEKGKKEDVVLELEKAKESLRKNHKWKVSAIMIFVLFSVGGCLVYYFNIKTTNAENLLFRTTVSALMQKEIDDAKEVIKLKDAIIKWNKELSKPLESLTFEDFSVNTIRGTPEHFIPLINAVYEKYGILGSLSSSQIWTETRFKEGLVYYGPINQGKILDFKQVWNGRYKPNTKIKAYDTYIKYFSKYDTYTIKSAWHLYKGEVSVGSGQINLGYGAQDHILRKDAESLSYSINFVGERLKYTKDRFSKESVLFIAMAYNNVGSAKNGQDLISVGYNEKKFLALPVEPTKDHKENHKNQDDLNNAKDITNYGKETVSMARNQRLIELYKELFSNFQNNKEVPEMELLPVNQEYQNVFTNAT